MLHVGVYDGKVLENEIGVAVYVHVFFAFYWVLLVQIVYSIGLGKHLLVLGRLVDILEEVLLVVEKLVLIHSRLRFVILSI